MFFVMALSKRRVVERAICIYFCFLSRSFLLILLFFRLLLCELLFFSGLMLMIVAEQ